MDVDQEKTTTSLDGYPRYSVGSWLKSKNIYLPSRIIFIFISIHLLKKPAKFLWANQQFSLGPKHIFHKKYDSETKTANKNQEG